MPAPHSTATRWVIIGDRAACDFDPDADPDAIVTGLLFRRVFRQVQDAERVAYAYPHRRPQIIPGQWADLEVAEQPFLDSFLPCPPRPE